jgi:hypothetical protein
MLPVDERDLRTLHCLGLGQLRGLASAVDGNTGIEQTAMHGPSPLQRGLAEAAQLLPWTVL